MEQYIPLVLSFKTTQCHNTHRTTPQNQMLNANFTQFNITKGHQKPSSNKNVAINPVLTLSCYQLTVKLRMIPHHAANEFSYCL